MVEIDVAETILGALRARRSVGKVKPDPVPRELVERVIEAATWAPNHHLTRPWRFVVVTGRAREELGAAFAASLRSRLDNPSDERTAVLLERERAKPLRAPVLIAVAVVPSSDPKVKEVEEIAAVAAGVQNMLLAAAALGLGAMWRTGDPAYDPPVKRFLGLPDEAHLLAFVYLGYPDMPPPREHESDAGSYTTWLGWDEPAS
ncbi:MAG TPA: nitroreductase [Chloroflexota bacterium]|nr:nitroreductase [Chloroflexota bacterium]